MLINKKYKHLSILSYFVIYLVWFAYIEKTTTTRFHVIHTFLDDYIPFCEYFVVPYFLWFVYIGWGILYFAVHDIKMYYRLCAFLFTGMTVFLVISTLYPNGHFLRPYYFSRHNVFTLLCEWLYRTDTPTNLFPSIHVYNSIGVYLAVSHSTSFRRPGLARKISGLLTVSIILSTVFIKQHSVFDVLTAMLLSFIMYYIVFLKNGFGWTGKFRFQGNHIRKSRP